MKRLHKDYMRSNEGYASWHKDPRHDWVHWLVLIVVVLGSVFAFTRVFKDYEVARTTDSNVSALYRAYVTNSQVKTIKQDTESLLSLRGERIAADTSRRVAIDQDMRSVAERRKNTMLTLIRTGNADKVLDTAISPADRAQLPVEVQAFVEKRETKTGTYDWLHADYFDTGSSENEYKIITPTKSYSVHYTNPQRVPDVTSGDEVRVDGLVFADEAVVVNTEANTEAVVNESVAADAAASPTTTKHLAIMLVNFQDDTTQPFTQAQVESTFFTANDSIKKFYEEGSFGQWTIDGDIFGYYTLPMNKPTAGGGCTSSYMYSVSSAADAAAVAAGVNMSSYTNRVYIFPKQSACSWNGLGTMGGTSRSWLNVVTTSQMLGTGAHELGHNFNLNHASGYRCTNTGGVAVAYYGGTCSSSAYEYSDPYDVMGNSTYRLHFNGFHKGVNASFGPNWLSSTNVVTLDPNGVGGTYTLKPLGAPTTGTQVLRIPISSSEYYYVEFRQPYGVFESFSTALLPATNGVLVHVAGSFGSTNQSKLIDMTPSTLSFFDAPLLPAQSYFDGNLSMTLLVNSVSSAGAVVTVSFDNGTSNVCTHFSPGVSVGNPQNTDSEYTKSYNVTVSNFDSSACGSSAFNFTATLPAGWTKTPESFTETIAPGQSLTKTFLVTYPTTVTAGYNTITFHGANATTGLASFASSQSVQQLVVLPGTPPQVTLISPAENVSISGDVSLSAYMGGSAINNGLSIKLYLDSVLKKTCVSGSLCSYTVPSAEVSAGTHIAKAESVNTTTNLLTIDTATFTKTGTSTPAAPVITMTSPNEGESISGDVVLASALATGSVTTNVSSKLYLDGVLKQTCANTMTCSITIPAAQVTTGSHTASATATYTPNNTSTTDSNVFTKTASTPPVTVPTISIPIPVDNATYTSELVVTTALNTTTPANVKTEIFVDGVLKKTCNDAVSCLVTLLSSETTLGIHTISAIATYIPTGATSTASKTVTKVEVAPPATAPQVTVVSPSEGASITGDVALATSFPTGSTVTNVQTKLYLDGILKNTCTGLATCSITIPAAQVTTGSHTASATATHTPTGTTTTDSNTFQKTTATPPPPPPPTGGATTGSGLTLLTLITPTDGTVITGSGNVTVTATTSPESIADGNYIVLVRKINGTGTTYQIGNPCYTTTCTATINGFTSTFGAGTHQITARLQKPKPTGGWNVLSTVNINITKQ